MNVRFIARISISAAFLVASLAARPASAATGWPLFEPAVTYPGYGARVVSTDFNRDGNKDLATGNAVLLGRGDGRFGPPIPYPDGVSTASLGPFGALASGDFNRDGYRDLAIAGSRVAILLGRGDGSFAGPSYPNVSFFHPNDIVVADFDADGKQDLAVANELKTQGLTILLGTGNGSFTDGGRDYGFNPLSLSVADVNADGDPDLVSEFGVLPGGAGASFGSLIPIAKPDLVELDNALGDLNHDGLLDLVVPGFKYTQGDAKGRVNVYLGQGGGHFGSPTRYAIGGVVGGVVVTDLNRDGRLDVAVAGQPSVSGGQQYVAVLLGQSNATLASLSTYAAEAPGFLVAADFNHDHARDLASARSILLHRPLP